MRITNGRTAMVDRLEGTRLPPYAEATTRSMRELGPGGKGNHEALSDAAARNVGVALGAAVGGTIISMLHGASTIPLAAAVVCAVALPVSLFAGSRFWRKMPEKPMATVPEIS